MRASLPRLIGLAALAAALLPASSAAASQITSNGSTVTYTAAPGESNSVLVSKRGIRHLVRHARRAVPVGLRQRRAHDRRCPAAASSSPRARSTATRPRARSRATSSPTSATATTPTGAGTAPARSTRGAGNDNPIYGAGGDDSLHGGIGSDELRAGDGNDLLDGGPGDDYLEGDRRTRTRDTTHGTDTYIGGGGTTPSPTRAAARTSR